MTTTESSEFDAVLAGLLEQYADRVTVVPDLDAVLESESTAATIRSGPVAAGRRQWLVVAAALLIVAVGAATVSQRNGGEEPVATTGSTPAVIGPFVAGGPGGVRTRELGANELFVWLEPGVTDVEVDEIVALLGREPLVSSVVYVDIDETWAEFSDFWADSPEVLAAVSPDELPTSVRVTTPDPAALVAIIEEVNLPSIRKVQGADDLGSATADDLGD